MIITKTPFRMSFFGGGTDLKEFYEQYGGSVISTTFDKYVYVTVRHLPRFFTYKNQVTYSKIERTKKIDEIEHPMVKNAMKLLDMRELIISYDADLPARTGLGSSSSFAVGLLNAFYCLKGKYADKRRLADDAIYVERVMCDEAGGLQDQIAASFGGFNRINFSSEGYEVKPIIISPERKEKLNDNLMFFFTGYTRFSSEIQKDTKKNTGKNIETLLEMNGLTAVEFVLLAFWMSVVGVLTILQGIYLVYLAISIGQLWKKHPVAGSIGAYYILTLIINFAVGGLGAVRPEYWVDRFAVNMDYSAALAVVLIGATLYCVVLIGISAVSTKLILDKKLNIA